MEQGCAQDGAEPRTRRQSGRRRRHGWSCCCSEAASRLEQGRAQHGAGTRAQDGAETCAQLELGLVAGVLQIDAACARAGGGVRTS